MSTDSTLSNPQSAVAVSEEQGRQVVRLAGEHDVATVFAISQALLKAIDTDDDQLVVDLSGVTFMNGSTIAVLTAARDDLTGQGRRLTLRSPSKCARRLLELCDLGELVEANPPAPTTAAAPGALSSWVSVPTVEVKPASASADPPTPIRAKTESAPPRSR